MLFKKKKPVYQEVEVQLSNYDSNLLKKMESNRRLTPYEMDYLEINSGRLDDAYSRDGKYYYTVLRPVDKKQKKH